MAKLPPKPSQNLVYSILLAGFVFTIFYIAITVKSHAFQNLSIVGQLLLGLKMGIEILSIFYGLSYSFIGIAYLLMKPQLPAIPTNPVFTKAPPVGIIYLCCNDLEEDALRSIATLSYEGKIHLIIHDDSKDPVVNEETNRVAAAVKNLNPHLDIKVLRRRQKEGGKSGAMNYVLQQTSALYDFFIICDNDSTVLQPDIIQKTLPYFEQQKTAIVQYRSVGINHPSYGPANQILRNCIDAFHVMMTMYNKYGWQPFIGHNAMLRTQAVVEAGGFTPGFFSDDLDMTVRLNLKGYKVVYSGELCMGESHPPNYEAFRKRTYKWSYGCMQSFRAHAGSVLRSHLSLAEKFFFFIFTGFYSMQVLLLAYVIFVFLIDPFFFNLNPLSIWQSLFLGFLILLFNYLPFMAYFWKEGKFRQFLKPAFLGALVYGTTDFVCSRGTIDCLLGRKRKWIPTNQVTQNKGSFKLFLEPLFGILLLIVPLFVNTSILLLPCAYLWAGKFLFVPTLNLIYNDTLKNRVYKKRKRIIGVAGLILLMACSAIIPVNSAFAKGNIIEVHSRNLYVDGQPYFIKGIHYGPWRPGSGPNKNYQYPTAAQVESDLKLIKAAHANTILVYDAPAYVLDLAGKYDLKVMYTFAVNWYAVQDTSLGKQQENIVQKVNALRTNKALLGWVIGNEIPEYALHQYGNHVFEKAIQQVYTAIKQVDAGHPVTHSNWPPSKSLNLSFLDIISFNVYPVWPPEVVAQGYGNYIKNFIAPIAGTKPLLITEFGVNSLEGGEDGQAHLIKQCWDAIQGNKTIGAFVFEFADEWWKNYDNPQSADNYWFRQADSTDELRHDKDPEEYYGIMTADRRPKKAYAIVQGMYTESSKPDYFLVPAIIISVLVIAALLWYLSARRKNS